MRCGALRLEAMVHGVAQHGEAAVRDLAGLREVCGDLLALTAEVRNWASRHPD